MSLTLIIVIVIVIAMFAVLSASSSPEPPPPNLTDEDVREAAKSGAKIKAIKWYRALHKVDLKTAKEAVEAMMRG
jgi:large subunit ribosomal protein L7/L12